VSNAHLMFRRMIFRPNYLHIFSNIWVNPHKNTYTVRDLPSWYGKIAVTFHGKCLYEFTLDTFILTRS